VLDVLAGVRFLAVAVLDFLVVVFALLLTVLGVALLTVFAGVFVARADVRVALELFAAVTLGELADAVVLVGAIASIRGVVFFGGAVARTCRIAVACSSSVVRNS
jgi:hypothetical protein